MLQAGHRFLNCSVMARFHFKRICLSRKKLRITLYVIVGFVFATTLIFLFRPWYFVDVGYYLRPIWDKPDRPWTIIPHYYASNVSMEKLCKLHKWTEIPEGVRQPRVFDAIIFSVELDLLEIRLHELYEVVDKFIIVEANATFTGIQKELLFQKNQHRYKFAEQKIVYSWVPLYPLKSGEGPFVNEKKSRVHLDTMLSDNSIGISSGDLVIMTDVDEIPSAHTVQMLKSCHGIPKSIHLQLRNYLYSFEFFYDWNSWRGHIETWVPHVTEYHHGRKEHENILLADAGWHCSFCFRKIEDFIFKMTGYSHADRVRYPQLLSPERIQNVICQGEDLFNMLPEAFTFKELFLKMGRIPKLNTAINLPSYLIENSDKFSFLLPGGCIRSE